MLRKVTISAIVAVILLLPLYRLVAATVVPDPPPPPGHLVDVGGYRVHLYCTGAGSPTVMVVGGAFSFDWGLVQPEVAKRTRICTYDPSGTAWSDLYRPTDPKRKDFTPLCIERITELHQLLGNAGISGPFVLVGFSIGGLIGRLYAQQYPEQVVGMVIVDHAFLAVGSDAPAPSSVTSSSSSPKSMTDLTGAAVDSPPVLISAVPITLGMEDDQNFQRLPPENQAMHTWAMSIHPLRPTAEMATECLTAVDNATKGLIHPLGDRPLLVISIHNDSLGYRPLQANLLLLSRNSKQLVAEKSSHMVIIDEPELVSAGVLEVVDAARNGNKWK